MKTKGHEFTRQATPQFIHWLFTFLLIAVVWAGWKHEWKLPAATAPIGASALGIF